MYLYGRKFVLYTDHRPLEWRITSPNLTGMHARWALMLQEFDFEVKYRKGLVNMNADGLSRSPLPETDDITGARVHDSGSSGEPGVNHRRGNQSVGALGMASLVRRSNAGGTYEPRGGWGGGLGHQGL